MVGGGQVTWLLMVAGVVAFFAVREDREARRENRRTSWGKVFRHVGWDLGFGLAFVWMADRVGWMMALIVMGIGSAVVVVAGSFVRDVVRGVDRDDR